MSISRRNFLELSLKGVLVIGAGNTLQSFAAATFKMPAKKDVLLRYALVSDGHYGQPGTDYDMHHGRMIDWVNKEKSGRGVEFTIFNGDTIHNGPEFLPQVKKKWENLKTPLYVSRGNHDMVTGDVWEKVWGMPLNYTFEKGKDIAFIVLDTANEKGEYICPNVSWAEEQLNKFKDKKHLFVIMHITPFKWTGGGNPCPEIVELFNKQANLKCIFHGHDHDQDGVKENEGKYYFFDSHIAGNWGTEYRGYRIVEVLKSGEILTYQMDAVKEMRVNEKTV
jgi:predicted MPP superfamily phosphohydrolase